MSAVDPLETEAPPIPERAAVGWALLAGTVTFVAAGWAVGLGVAAVVFAALVLQKGQPMLRILGTALFAAAAGFVIAKQARGGYLVDFNWMNLFELTHAWTLAAVALLVLDPLVARIRSAACDTRRTEPGSDR